MNERFLHEFFYEELNYDINDLSCEIKKLPLNNLQDIMIFIGIFENDNKKRQLVVPRIDNIQSFLINIHEYTHEIIYESNLENINSDDYLEVVAIKMERFYILKYYQSYLDKFNANQLERLEYYMTNQKYFYRYILAYYYQFVLINKFNQDISKILNYKFDDKNYDLNVIGLKTLKLLKK